MTPRAAGSLARVRRDAQVMNQPPYTSATEFADPFAGERELMQRLTECRCAKLVRLRMYLGLWQCANCSRICYDRESKAEAR